MVCAMSKERVFRREMRRAIITTTLGIASMAASVAVRFAHPDDTWARIWMDHPWHQAAPTVLLVAAVASLWWPWGCDA